LLVFLGATLALPADAQTWGNFFYQELGVGVQLPGAPTVTQSPYPTAKGSVPATVYAWQQDTSRFTLTVADFAGHGGEKNAAVQNAIAAARAGGDVKLDVPECISGQPGREFSVVGRDGSMSKISVFAIDNRFYLLEAKILPPNVQRDSGDAARFQQSLNFSRDGHPNPACKHRAAEASRVAP
jgi:hypothetical protein